MKPDTILLDHGSGGKISHRLITDMVLPLFDNPMLARLDDGAVCDVQGLRLAFSTDSYTVDPIFFPGGDIGELAVNGTVNDLAMCGAVPLFLSAALIVEEGFALRDLETILKSMQTAARTAGVQIVTGDTKVVPKGAADKIFINTAGIGHFPEPADVSGANARPGDAVLVSGTIGDHGVTILTRREGIAFDTPVTSDTAALNHMVRRMQAAAGGNLHVLRDPTRGGVGTTLNEIARSSGVGIRIHESRLPVRPEVAGLCEILGLDPLYVANEGKLLACVAPKAAQTVLAAMQQDPHGRSACLIGEVTAEHPGRVHLQTEIGGHRIVDMLSGEQLPRIC